MGKTGFDLQYTQEKYIVLVSLRFQHRLEQCLPKTNFGDFQGWEFAFWFLARFLTKKVNRSRRLLKKSNLLSFVFFIKAKPKSVI